MRFIRKVQLFFNCFSDKKMEKMYKEFAMNLALQHVHPENIVVHSDGGFGQAGIVGTILQSPMRNTITYKGSNGGWVYGLPKPELPYTLMPEIDSSKDAHIDQTWAFQAWLHEVGHIVNKHHDQPKRAVYLRELEAEQYCMEQVKEFGHSKYSWAYVYMLDNAREYLYSHCIKAANQGYIPQAIVRNVKDFLGEEYTKKLERELRIY